MSFSVSVSHSGFMVLTILKPVDKLELILGIEGPNDYYFYDERSCVQWTGKEVYNPGVVSRIRRGILSTTATNGQYQVNLLASDGGLKASLKFDNGNLARRMVLSDAQGKEIGAFRRSSESLTKDIIEFGDLRIEKNYLSYTYLIQRNGNSLAEIGFRPKNPIELLSDAHTYSINFHEEVDEELKLVVFSALIFIDVTVYEDS